MYQEEAYRSGLGQTYDRETRLREIANGTSGYDGGIDRSNGLEKDEGSLPYELFDSSTEAMRHAEDYIKSCVIKDVETYGVEQMCDVEFVLDRALIAYGSELSDTSFKVEVAVAEYLGSLANELLAPEAVEVSEEDVEVLFAEIAQHLEAIDERISVEQNELIRL
jgi:hypothetical protein